MQAHARVCEENRRELEINDAYRNNFMVTGTRLKDHMHGESEETCIEMIFSKVIYHNIKVLLLYLVLVKY